MNMWIDSYWSESVSRSQWLNTSVVVNKSNSAQLCSGCHLSQFFKRDQNYCSQNSKWLLFRWLLVFWSFFTKVWFRKRYVMSRLSQSELYVVHLLAYLNLDKWRNLLYVSRNVVIWIYSNEMQSESMGLY